MTGKEVKDRAEIAPMIKDLVSRMFPGALVGVAEYRSLNGCSFKVYDAARDAPNNYIAYISIPDDELGSISEEKVIKLWGHEIKLAAFLVRNV